MAQKESPKSRWQSFREFLSKKDKEVSDIKIEGLPDNMVKLVLDKKMKVREEEMNELLQLISKPLNTETLNLYFDDMIDIVNTVNTAIFRIAIPFVRAGDSSDHAKLVSGWSEFNSFFLSYCTQGKIYWGNNDKLMERKTGINLIHARNLHVTLINHYMSWSSKVLAFSFTDKDVKASIITVIQNMMPAPFGNIDINKTTENM